MRVRSTVRGRESESCQHCESCLYPSTSSKPTSQPVCQKASNSRRTWQPPASAMLIAMELAAATRNALEEARGGAQCRHVAGKLLWQALPLIYSSRRSAQDSRQQQQAEADLGCRASKATKRRDRPRLSGMSGR